MLSCKKATELVEKRIVEGLSSKEKVQLKMHNSMCDACRSYEKQSIIMDEAVKQYANGHHHNNLKLPSDSKEEIIKSLEKK